MTDTRHWGRQVALTRDEQFLYACGESNDYDYNLLKLNADDGTVVWQVENSTIGFQLMTLDAAEDVIVYGTDSTGANGVLKKYDSNGNPKWSVPLTEVTGIACDSNNNIYVTRQAGVSPGLHKYDADGNYLGGATIGGDVLYDVKVDSADNVIVAGDNVVIAGNNRQLFKYNTSLTLLDSAATGAGTSSMEAFRLAIDSLRGIVVLSRSSSTGISYMDKFNPALTQQWGHEGPYGMWDITNALATDVQNRVHFLKAANVAQPGYTIRDGDTGTPVKQTNRFMGGTAPFGLACSRTIYAARHTDRTTMNHYRADMCCFQDDSIEEFDHYGYTGRGPYPGVPYPIGTIIWCEVNSIDPLDQGYIWQPELVTGIFEVVALETDLSKWPGNSPAYKRLSQTPGCNNANWDQYDGVPGGIGGSPEVYTVTFAGMYKVSDPDTLSAYNGEYLLVRGPGIKGLFVSVHWILNI